VMSGLHKTRLDATKNPELAANTRKALAQFGTPADKVGEYFTLVAAQEPGQLTGNYYRMRAGVTSESYLLEGHTRSASKI
jgi:hypothetical protein